MPKDWANFLILRNQGVLMKLLKTSLVAGLGLVLSGCTSLISGLSGEVILDTRLLEETIEEGVLDQTGLTSTATCPDSLSGVPGDVRQCTVEDDFGGIYFVDVTIQNREGDITWQVRP